jgi:uncharacterized membrane protein
MFDLTKPISNEVVFGTVLSLIVLCIVIWQILKYISKGIK